MKYIALAFLALCLFCPMVQAYENTTNSDGTPVVNPNQTPYNTYSSNQTGQPGLSNQTGQPGLLKPFPNSNSNQTDQTGAQFSPNSFNNAQYGQFGSQFSSGSTSNSSSKPIYMVPQYGGLPGPINR